MISVGGAIFKVEQRANDSWGGCQTDLGLLTKGWTVKRILSKLVALDIDADLNIYLVLVVKVLVTLVSLVLSLSQLEWKKRSLARYLVSGA